jgi:predicted acetyltransferase
VTLSDPSYGALWRFVLGIDLVEEIRTQRLPLDEPVRFMLEDHRQMRVVAYGEKTWLRLVDVGACLASRRYDDEGSLLLEVEDAFCPWNTGLYRLEAIQDLPAGGEPASSPDGAVLAGGADGFAASVERLDEVALGRAVPDVRLDVESLASIYLGGLPVSALARAGRIRASSERSLVRAERMFRTREKPFCSSQF